MWGKKGKSDKLKLWNPVYMEFQGSIIEKNIILKKMKMLFMVLLVVFDFDVWIK